MGKREAANPKWGEFLAHHSKHIEDRPEPPDIAPKPSPASKLEDIPPDVPYDDDTLTCWNGKAFVSWDKWRLSVAFRRTTDPENPPEGGSA